MDIFSDSPTFQVAVIVALTGVSLLLLFAFNRSGFVGVIPAEMKLQLDREGLVFLDESVPMTLRLRQFRAPGKYSSFSIKRGRGAFAVSKKRVVGYGGFPHCVIDVPFDHPKIAALNFSNREDSALCVSFEASEFNAEQSGGIELRFRLANVSQAITLLKKMTKR